ncbi:hypothetical protein [Petroclostridium sp. X23]|jgi:hypothetical protein|uniref:hypothetical protein n=1 Tax=Petroclostridium sp. X23 TaxID=3045146 RepID=UPI0024AE2723|nr:hypothetical protein [Petroclostridium sp. X23]WHH61387.1 hypothetical protein QKW49_12095 [Petroclostridium sp. X23]
MKKYLRVQMSNGELYDIPVEIIAENRARYYAAQSSDRITYHASCLPPRVFEDEKNYGLENNDILLDWAKNNMTWDALEEHAIKVKQPVTNYNDEWMNCKKEIISY